MTNKTLPPQPTQITWLIGRAFASGGIILAVSAIVFSLWQLTHPAPPLEVPPIFASSEPILLPETPLLEDLVRAIEAADGGVEGQASDIEPRPLPDSYTLSEQEPLKPPDRLSIPSIELDTPIQGVGWATVDVGGQQVGQWQVPDEKVVGWHDASAGLGQKGNTVLNGHHNIYGQVFRQLVDVRVGDSLALTSADEQFEYVVSETLILPERGQPVEVRLQNAQYILPTNDERITLVTCWPFTGNSHRLLIIATPAPASQLDQLLEFLVP